MKVRIGFGFGVRTKLNDGGFAEVVDALEALQFDSLWLSERIGGEAPDPLVGMAYAAGRTTHLKFGMSVMVLPGNGKIVVGGQASGGFGLQAFNADGSPDTGFGGEFGAAPGTLAEPV